LVRLAHTSHLEQKPAASIRFRIVPKRGQGSFRHFLPDCGCQVQEPPAPAHPCVQTSPGRLPFSAPCAGTTGFPPPVSAEGWSPKCECLGPCVGAFSSSIRPFPCVPDVPDGHHQPRSSTFASIAWVPQRKPGGAQSARNNARPSATSLPGMQRLRHEKAIPPPTFSPKVEQSAAHPLSCLLLDPESASHPALAEHRLEGPISAAFGHPSGALAIANAFRSPSRYPDQLFFRSCLSFRSHGASSSH